MTTTLRVIVDDILAPSAGGDARYTEELTRYLIQTAPAGCEVAGMVASSPSADYKRILELLPGLSNLGKSPLARRDLTKAWQHGFPRIPAKGMVHAPSLFAPLFRHDRLNNVGDQTVVTVQNALAWTHPEALNPRDVAWQKTMAKRAHKYAEAVVVPTHAVAAELEDAMHFGGRIRVIGAAVSSTMMLPPNDDERALALELPEQYLLARLNFADHKGLTHLVTALASDADTGLPLLLAGTATAMDTAVLTRMQKDAGLAEGRIRVLGELSDDNLAVVLNRATVFVYPSLAAGFGLPVLEAFFFGTPVVHSDAPALVEVAGGAGISVPVADLAGYPQRLAEAIASIVTDAAAAKRLSYAGLDRAGAFSWRDSAQLIWQLHADL